MSGIARIRAEVALGWPNSGPRTERVGATWSATLFVDTLDGKRLSIGSMGGSSGAFFGAPAPVTRKGIEEKIEHGLGRVPNGPGLPRRLRKAGINRLTRKGITISEDELVAAPMVFEFSDDLLAALDG